MIFQWHGGLLGRQKQMSVSRSGTDNSPKKQFYPVLTWWTNRFAKISYRSMEFLRGLQAQLHWWLFCEQPSMTWWTGSHPLPLSYPGPSVMPMLPLLFPIPDFYEDLSYMAYIRQSIIERFLLYCHLITPLLSQGRMRQVTSTCTALRLILSVPVLHSFTNQAARSTCISYLKVFPNSRSQTHRILWLSLVSFKTSIHTLNWGFSFPLF